MQRSTVARNAIGPLLDQLIVQLECEGRATQRAYFNRIRTSLNTARHDIELATPILELTSTHAVGFRFSEESEPLIARIVEKAAELGMLLDEISEKRQ